MKIRFFAMAWDWGVAELETVLAPSLLQPGNIPWLLANGYDVQFTAFTIERDAPRVQGALQRLFAGLGVPSEHLDVSLAVLSGIEPGPNFKKAAFLTECRNAIAENAAVVIASTDFFFGDESIRNLATYCRKPDVVAAGVHLRVRREPFLELLGRYRKAFGDKPLPNAKLVDMCMQTLIDCLENSKVDHDLNASASTAVAIRSIAPDLFTVVHHLPTPTMFWPNQSDVQYLFERGGAFELVDHVWAEKLTAEGRWRLLASSDLFFMVELTSTEEEQRKHTFPAEKGMLYNEHFPRDRPHLRMHEQILVTLRREPFLS
jgi:hypothetical protein